MFCRISEDLWVDYSHITNSVPCLIAAVNILAHQSHLNVNKLSTQWAETSEFIQQVHTIPVIVFKKSRSLCTATQQKDVRLVIDELGCWLIRIASFFVKLYELFVSEFQKWYFASFTCTLNKFFCNPSKFWSRFNFLLREIGKRQTRSYVDVDLINPGSPFRLNGLFTREDVMRMLTTMSYKQIEKTLFFLCALWTGLIHTSFHITPFSLPTSK